MLIVGSKHSATGPSVALESQIVQRCVCYRIGSSSFELPYLVGSRTVVFFEEGDGLNDSSFSCSSPEEGIFGFLAHYRYRIQLCERGVIRGCSKKNREGRSVRSEG